MDDDARITEIRQKLSAHNLCLLYTSDAADE